MKKILFTILLSFVAIFAYSQVNYSFRGKANIYSATRGTGVDTAKWVILAVFSDDMTYYASDSLALGDYIYTTSDFGCAALRVDTINSKTGGIFNLDVTDMNNVLTSISGVSYVFTPTPNQGYPTFAQGLPAQIQACIITDLALRVDDALSNVTPDSTIFQTVYRGDTSAQAIRQEIADSNAIYPTIGTLLQNKFPFASGSKSMTTTLGYLGRETGRVFVDSLAAFRLPSWLTAGRIASPLNGDMAYNSTLHLTDIYVNGAWRNGVLSSGALTAGGVPYVDANGHLAYDSGLRFTSGSPHDVLQVGGTIASPLAPLAVKSTGNSFIFQARNSGDTYNIGSISDGGIFTVASSSSNSASVQLVSNKGYGGYPSNSFWSYGSSNNVVGIGTNVGASSTVPSIQMYGLTSTSSGTNTNIVYIDTEHSPSFGGGATAGTGSFTVLGVGGVINQTVSSKNIVSLAIKPTVTAMVGNYTALSITPNIGTAIAQSGASAINVLAGNTRFGGVTSPAYTVDITGTLAVSSRTGTATSIAGFDANGKAVNVPLSGLTLNAGTLEGAAAGSTIIGVCVDTVAQTSHGFALGDIIYWTGSAYADFVGTTGDTITPSGIVYESINVNTFSYATCGVVDNDFTLPDGLYYATGAGFNLVPDTLQIPILKVEGAKSTVITPVPYSDEVGTVELFTMVTDTGSVVIYGGDSFDLPEAIRSDELGAETSSTPTTAAKFTIHLVDCTSGVREVDTPASPVAGDWFAVSDSRSNAATNNITIDTSTDKLGGASVDYVMNVNGQFVRFTYVNSTIGWIKSNQ